MVNGIYKLLIALKIIRLLYTYEMLFFCTQNILNWSNIINLKKHLFIFFLSFYIFITYSKTFVKISQESCLCICYMDWTFITAGCWNECGFSAPFDKNTDSPLTVYIEAYRGIFRSTRKTAPRVCLAYIFEILSQWQERGWLLLRALRNIRRSC